MKKMPDGIFRLQIKNLNLYNLPKLIFILFLISCSEDNIPPELNQSFNFIEEHWTKEQQDAFKNNSEERALLMEYKVGMGLYLRNNWIRNNEHSSKITAYFFTNDVHHLEDMSAIILVSYHRYLNHQPLEIEKQFSDAVDYQENYTHEGKVGVP